MGQGAPWWAWGPMEGYRGALEEACTDWPQICSITATPYLLLIRGQTDRCGGSQEDGTDPVKDLKIGMTREKYIGSAHLQNSKPFSLFNIFPTS